MSLSYIKRAEQGNRSALAFIATLFLCIGGLVMGQSLPIMLVGMIKAKKNGFDYSQLNTTQKIIDYLPFPLSFSLLMLGFVALIIMLWLGVKMIHRRKFGTLWSDQDTFRWKHFLWGIGISVVLFISADLLIHYLSPGDHKWVFNPSRFFIFLPVALLFIPIQTCSEELFFRGYLYQMFGMAFKNKWLALIISGIIFGAFHFGNQEMGISFWKMAIVYIGSGIMIGLSVLLSKGIEFGWGFHLVNNMYLTLITTFPGSSLDGPTLYMIPKPTSDRVLIEFALQFIVFTGILLVVYRKNVKSLFSPSI